MSQVVPAPVNEPVHSYAPKTPARAELTSKLKELSADKVEIPLIIGGQEIRTGNTAQAVMPHRHTHVIATWHKAGAAEIQQAIKAAVQAQREWAAWPWEDRAAVFLRAAELLATTWRSSVNAATMLGQSKTSHQAEIDAACELIDFWRFNVAFADKLYSEQPISSPGVWNRTDYRPLEGFIYAVSPFNFTAIGGNLSTAPAMLGNTVVWKPASTAVYSGYLVARLLHAAGLPPGVINFVPGDARTISDAVLTHNALAGVHFTGSTEVFQEMWRTVGTSIDRYRSYPRLVGETGGKDFIVAHESADPDALVTAIVRGAFEYQGQKCSAASRIYVPASMWKKIRKPLVEQTQEIPMGDVADFRNFMGAVIDKKAFYKISNYIEHARKSSDAEVIAGGEAKGDEGYFIRPTIIEAKAPNFETMCEEIFGPVVTVYAYPDGQWSQTLDLVDTTSPYALTGAVFANDRRAVREALYRLRQAAGNFYINDKPTGAVVGQQPFGGARASGTNDKAGSILNLVRWVSARSIKETLVPPVGYRYPFMEKE
jgi:1-pyrroline-5-carboxylate dehydrogenase